MQNEKLIKWSIWIGTCFFSLVFALIVHDNYGIFPALLANLILIGTIFIWKYHVARVSCLLAAVVMLNCAVFIAMFTAFISMTAVNSSEAKYAALVKDLQDHGIVFQR